VKTRVLWARHGRIANNLTGIYSGRSADRLDPTGRRQAELLARRLALRPPDLIVTSPVARAVETAAAVAARCGLTAAAEDYWAEIDFGLWSGLDGGAIGRGWPREWEAWRAAPHETAVPGGEGLEDVRVRLRRGLARLRDEWRGKTVLIVAHDVTVRLAVLEALDLPTRSYRRFRADNASLTGIVCDPDPVRVEMVNDTGHLEELER